MKLFTTFFFASALLTATSCTSEVTDSLQDDAHDNAIAFGTPQTKAAIEGNFPDGSTFAVWGWYTNTDDTSGNPFDRETVTNSGGTWNYSGGTRYWVLGATYNFYAVYPNTVNAKCTSDGAITITDFDASKTGADAVDLMTAGATDITHATAESIEPVPLRFRHALTRVDIAVKLDDDLPQGYRVTINTLTLSAHSKGDMTLDAATTEAIPRWTVDETIITQYRPTLQNQPITAGTTNEAVHILADVLLAVPQTIQKDNTPFRQLLTLNYKLENDKQEGEDGYQFMENTASIPLANASVTQWNPGESLTYMVTISNTNVALQLVVGDWEDGNSGNEDITME